jgi:hypothetical protein
MQFYYIYEDMFICRLFRELETLLVLLNLFIILSYKLYILTDLYGSFATFINTLF